MQVQVTKCEILYDDNISMVMKLRADGIDVDLHEYDHGFHVFQLLAGKLSVADKAIDTVKDFIAMHLQR